MTYLFLRLLKDDLKEYTYAARLAGLVYGIASGMNAILVSTPFEVWREVGVPMKGPLWGFDRVWKWLGSIRSVWLCEVLCVLFVQPEGFLGISACCTIPRKPQPNMSLHCRRAAYRPLEMSHAIITAFDFYLWSKDLPHRIMFERICSSDFLFSYCCDISKCSLCHKTFLLLRTRFIDVMAFHFRPSWQ